MTRLQKKRLGLNPPALRTGKKWRKGRKPTRCLIQFDDDEGELCSFIILAKAPFEEVRNILDEYTGLWAFGEIEISTTKDPSDHRSVKALLKALEDLWGEYATYHRAEREEIIKSCQI